MTPDQLPDDLRAQLAKALEAGRSEPADCPDPQALWAAVHGDLPVAEVGAVARHAATCPRCRLDWEVARRGRRLEEEDAAGRHRSEPRIVSPVRRPSRWKLPVAAAALLAVGLFLGRGGLFSTGPAFLGSGDEVTIESTSGPTAPRGEDLTLSWRLEPAAPDALYDVSVSYLLDTVYEETDLGAAEVTIPWSRLGEIPSGATLHWSVTARRGEERERADFILRIE